MDGMMLKTKDEITPEQKKQVDAIMEKLHPSERIVSLCNRGHHFMRCTTGVFNCDVCGNEDDDIAECEGCGTMLCSVCWEEMYDAEPDDVRQEKHLIEVDRCTALSEAAQILCKNEDDKRAMAEESQYLLEREMEYQHKLDELKISVD